MYFLKIYTCFNGSEWVKTIAQKKKVKILILQVNILNIPIAFFVHKPSINEENAEAE